MDHKRIKVDSSCIAEVWFDQTLFVRFHTGSVYKYEAVQPHLFRKLLRAQSKGRFLNRYIKAFYGFVQVSG